MRGERRKGEAMLRGRPGEQTAAAAASGAGCQERPNSQLCPFHAAPAPLRGEAGGGGEGRVTRHGCLLKRISSAGSGG